ncbi:RHS repeat-associated core domain-containing protein [Flavobacterium fontis]|uniref:RHS repeat-associated core domain-containing protein n=2 Tax=Flavobacterium fontis TaxID=1124188 RepID=A0A1M4WYG9_9FLAO|nr:RHS repeat-associated core domain-containing protein [Flavobacterium fontis]
MAEQRGQHYYNSPYKFNGKELDEETGLYYYGARYFDPKVSIWLSVDPLAEKFPNVSPYNYCLQNPIRFIDPDGKAPKPPKLSGVTNIPNVMAGNNWIDYRTKAIKIVDGK